MSEVSEGQSRIFPHTTERSSSPSRRRYRALLFTLAIYVLAVHGGFFVYDILHNFAPFLWADRAWYRIYAIARLLSAGSWREIHHVLITNKIIIGEYLAQAGLYAAGGALAVVVFQMFLQTFAVLAVFRVALLTLNSMNLSFATALVYATLPHSLVFPHQLSSEAIGVPVMVIGYWLFFEYRVGGKPIGYLLAAGTMLGLAACARPALLLLPILLSPFAARDRSRQAITGAVSFAAVGLLPILLWVALVWSGTGHPSLGHEMGSLEYNLYLRVLSISRSVPLAEGAAMTDRYLGGLPATCPASLTSYLEDPRADWPDAVCALSLPRYISFVAHYPAASLRDLLRDILVLAMKPGTGRLTIDYVLSPSSQKRLAVHSMKYGFRTTWESQGLLVAIRSVVKVNPIAVLVELVGAAAFSALFLSFLFGLIVVARRAFDRALPSDRTVGLRILGLHSLYVFMTTLAAASAQDRLRYPAEFAISILAAFGAATAFALYRERRGGGYPGGSATRPKIG